MTGLQPETPLTQLEAIFRVNEVEFDKFDDGTLLLELNSLAWGKQSLKYTVSLAYEQADFVSGTIFFEAPLGEKGIKKLAVALNSWVKGVVIGYEAKKQLLTATFYFSPDTWGRDVYSAVDFCDLLQPLVAHIRRTGDCSIALADLALDRIEELPRA